jgi:hypothetical protein
VSGLARLRAYRFQPGTVFEGGLVGAIERMQLGGDARLLDALFVTRDADSGALYAIDLATGGAGSTFAALLDFRLDPGRRRALTERTLVEHSRGVPRPLIEAIAATLEAGAALLAVLDTGGTTTALEDAVARCGGHVIADEPIDARALAQASSRLRAAVGMPASGA